MAESIAHALRPGDVVVLDGPLGAGKTTFTQGLARGLHVSGRVTSPTFTIAREHPGPVPLIHVDAYRLLGDTTTDPIGALDSLDLDTRIPDSIVVAEWAADMADALEQDYLLIRLERATGGSEKSDGNDASAGGDPSTSADPVDFDEDEPRVISWTWVRR
ncbi:MAG: tRNA (adenosine(37)-N6)-threonylcarbamoyltransferase complex ATPase subunit type 1 TsaE [Corynebacterium kroppenstedtii]|nr:tRNA (adenosine(37)-N6)-threonylcarbamoyltransferase complex ATPase subunit type 1 TsaE [Corynebacterium kroppenstedtii]